MFLSSGSRSPSPLHASAFRTLRTFLVHWKCPWRYPLWYASKFSVNSLNRPKNTTGLQIYMVFHTCSLLLRSDSASRGWKHATVKFYVIYGFVMLVLTTFALSANIIMGQLMWIEHRDFPEGSFSYYIANSTLWINILGTAACIVGNYLNDALLVLPSFSYVTFIRQPFFFTRYIVAT